MSPILAAVLAFVAPLRQAPGAAGRPARLDPDRLSAHLCRDLGLVDGRDRPGRDGRQDL